VRTLMPTPGRGIWTHWEGSTGNGARDCPEGRVRFVRPVRLLEVARYDVPLVDAWHRDSATAGAVAVLWWKVSYRLLTAVSGWPFGRVAFIRAVNQDDAHTRARRFIGLIESGATIRRVDSRRATVRRGSGSATRAGESEMEAERGLGIPNDPRSL